MKNNINLKFVSEIAKNILDAFYTNGFHMELAKDKEKYGCNTDETFIEHSMKTLNYSLAIADLYYQENPQRNINDNIKKLVIGALFHDVNKISKYKKERETEFELKDIELILSDLGLYSEYNDCSKFILSSSIHRGRKYNTYKLAYALDENEEEIKIIRFADALASVYEINNVISILKDAFVSLGLKQNYKINYLKIKELRPAITNIMLKALEEYMNDTERKLFCYIGNYVIYIGEKIDFDLEIDDIVNKTLLIPTLNDKYLDAVASNVRDNKNNFNFFDMFLILDTDNQLEILRKSLTSKNGDILFRALKSRFEKVRDKIDKKLLNDTRFDLINKIINRKEDDLFIDLVRQIFICLNSYHVFLINEKNEDVYEEVLKVFNQEILNLNVLDKMFIENIGFIRNFKKVLDDGGSKSYYILLSSYIANLVLQTDHSIENINKIQQNFKYSFEENMKKFKNDNKNVSLLKKDLKDYFFEVFNNKVNESDYIFKDKKIESTCLICGRKIPDDLGAQKGFLGTKYSFKSKPKEIVINDKGRLTKEITQQPFLCKICTYDTLLQKVIFNLPDTFVSPDVYIYTHKNIDFPINIDVFKMRKEDMDRKIEERTLTGKKFNEKSIFVKVAENNLEIEIHKQRFSKQFPQQDYRFNIFNCSSKDAESVLKTYYQALVLAYYYGLNVTITSSKTLNVNNIDILFNGDYKNIYLNKLKVKKLTNINNHKELNEFLHSLNSVFLIEDLYKGFKLEREKEIIQLITKMTVHPLGIFNYLRFKDSQERNNFFNAIYENNLVGPFVNAVLRIVNLNGGAQMSICSQITEKMTKFWKPKKSDSSYIITLPFRYSVKVIKENKTSDIQEMKEILCGSVRDVVERHNSVYSPAYGEDKIRSIEEFVDTIIHGYYEGVCNSKKGEVSKNENYYASAIEFLVIKSLYDDIKKREESENE